MGAGKVLAIDWGERRMGLALSDETRTLATTLPTLEVRGPRWAVAEVARLIDERGVGVVVLGDPRHMDGRESRIGGLVRLFAEALAKARPDVSIVLWDERLTSMEAMAILKERGERVRSKGRVDQLSAAVLLQCYLDSESP